ncbi:3-oxoacyl-[acyl-carrier-protein] synthase III C-terminal domain-containing protein [Bacillus massiliigorillae]|uniref:3-oxoacyl-[acyl-carrier-protein] synthase III C-terminal domain-containing protein n=1 Tax=Bacillus massiliigorillae TaxID=1243664 RepID=UPI0003A1449C|nr:3-oxoacyl-[acyl-carrier-protein] synthase III C-terminal domain-containing protein [Bacillus massiliigorillae]
MKSVKLKDVEILHPNFQVNNDYYITHFDFKGKDIRSFLKHMGRDKRFIIKDKEETTLFSLSKQVASDILKKNNLKGKDIDLIIYATQTPEYLAPTNATLIHEHIGADLYTKTLDINDNCSGMVTAIDIASRYIMTSRDIDKVLIVGGDFLNVYADPDNEIAYPNFGDGVSAIILESTTDESNIGFIDSIGHTNPVVKDKMVFPKEGLTKMLMQNQTNNYLQWTPFSTDHSNFSARDSISTILNRNNLTISDIALFCFSQFSLADVKVISESLNIDEDKVAYSGDKYGYTGTSSPIFALYDSINSGKVKRGDYILFWTVGSGFHTNTVLFKY